MIPDLQPTAKCHERAFPLAPDGHQSYRRTERLHGTFYRSFSLPDTADPEKIAAKDKNGALEAVIPTHAAGQPKRIKVAA